MTRIVRLAALLAVIALIPSTSAAPINHVTALAPVEIWADGFGDLHGIALDTEGAVYVADRLAGTVTRIGPDRSRTVLASGLDHPVGLAFDPSGRLVIAEEHGHRVIRVEGNGRQTVVISGIHQPRWVTFGADGTLYVSARASTPDGGAELEDGSVEPHVILRLTPSGQRDVLVDGLLGLRGIVVSEDVLYAATVGRPGGTPAGVVYAVTLLADGTAGPVTPVTGPDSRERPMALGLDTRHALFVTTKELAAVPDPSLRTLAKVHANGSRTPFAVGLADPMGLAFDGDGNLFLADGGAGRVVKFHAPAQPAFAPLPPYTARSPLDVPLTTEPGAQVVVAGAGQVSGTAGAEGVITLPVPLNSNAATALQAWTIGHAGEGLASSPAAAMVIHDSVAPTIALRSPQGGEVAGAVSVRADVRDAGTWVATVTVRVDGHVVSSSTAPALPAERVAVAAAFDGSTVTDGAHTVSVTATDRAGNVATVTHSIVVAPTGPSTAGSATSGTAPKLGESGGFTLAPASGTIVQGGTTSFGVSAPDTAKRAAELAVGGLPAGVTASFSPRRVAPGQTAELIVRAAPNAATGTTNFNVTADAATLVGQLTVVSGSGTTLVGRVVDTDRRPLAGVAIILDTITVSTDANGNFLMLDPPAGDQVVLIDGAPANTGANQYPTIPVSVTIVANRVNELPYRPHLHRQHQRFTAIDKTAKTIARDPDLPGVALHLEAGNDIIGWDGQPATKVSIRTVLADRLPVRPLPPDSQATKVYMFYFGKRGGGIPRRPVPFEAPNDLGLAPGEQAILRYFDESPRKGEAPNDWRIAGTATVSDDGKTLRTDPGVGIPKFCCGAAYFDLIKDLYPMKPGPSPQKGLAVLGADPVDLSTGIFLLRATDLVVPGRLPLTITRMYRSGEWTAGAFGLGTIMGYTEYLKDKSADVITYAYEFDGRTDFTRQADGTFINATVPALRGVTITVNANGTRTVRHKDGRTVTFTTVEFGYGLPTGITDANGNATTISREGTNQVRRITDAAGRTFTLTGTVSLFPFVSSITDPLGRTVSYEYDTLTRLVRVTNPAHGVTTYTYDDQHRMTAITDARGITYLTNTYDTNSRVCRQTQADGGVFTMYYVTTDIATTPASLQLLNEAAAGGPISQAPCSPVGSMSPVVATVLVDPRGNPTTYRFNGIGALTTITDALGQTTTYQRDEATNLIQSVTDPVGRVTSFTYDAAGNVLTVTDPGSNVRTLSYEPTFNKVTSLRDPLNQVTIFAYDSHGNLTSVRDPLNNQSTIAYNATGDPTSVTDPLNHTTIFTYDAVGNLLTATDPLGNTTARVYDGVSRLIAQTNPGGSTTGLAYDVLNRVAQMTDAKHGRTAFGYDPNGNLLSLMDARGSTTSYTYNAMDRVATRTDPLGHSESFAYDLAGNLSQLTDRKGQVATFTYDALNRRAGATYADATMSFTLDAVGRLTQVTDSIGGTITNAYDTLDRLTSQTTALGTISYQYDVLGRRTQMAVPGQTPVTYAYDAASRLTSITQGSNAVQFAYDAANRRTSLTLPNGVSTQYGYDAASQLTALTYKLGTTTLGDLQYLYDATGNRIQVGGAWARTSLPQAMPSATYNANNQQLTFGSQSQAYDLNGNLTSDGTNTYTWDARNRLAAITGPVPASFVYDAVGRRSRKTINSVITDFLYDGLNPVQEQSGSTITNLLSGLRVDEYFSRGDSTSTAFFLVDSLGSTVALADNAGGVPSGYTYEPFGMSSVTGSTSNPFDFTARETDLASLKYYRARYYHPGLRRFISEDPIGFDGGAVNLYAYARNNPILWTDPLGLRIEWGNYVIHNPFVISNLYGLNQAIIDRGLANDTFTLTVTGGDRYVDCDGIVRSATDNNIVPGSDATSPHLIENGARAVDLRATGVSDPLFDRALRETDFSSSHTRRGYADGHTHISLPPGRKYNVPPDSLPTLGGRKNTCRG